MIQFNLLPDVKLDYIKTRRTKRMVIVISLLAAGISLAVLTVMFLTVQVAQKKHMKDLTKDIASEVKILTASPDLDKILTIQNQLNSLPMLYDERPVSSRLFGYVQQITPAQANISKLDIDFDTNVLNITGDADSLLTINKFADTLKFATYKSEATDAGKPFNDVVTTLSQAQDGKASYTLTMSFDPVLFQSAEVPVLTVPKIISNRSETEKPSAIFKEQAKSKAGGN